MKNFKTLLNIAFIATTLLFTSCSKDDDLLILVEDLTIDFNENPTDGQTVGTVQTNGSGGFSITSQTPTGALSINTSTGELTVADATLFDFETNPVITATIEVVGATNTGTVTINLNDATELNAADLTIDFDENPTNGQTVDILSATNGSGTLSFSITSQTPVGALSIDPSTGELTVADAALFDFETNPVITANISVVDAINTTTTTVTINLNDVAELDVADLTVDFDENPTNGQTVDMLSATNGSGTLSFSITSQTPTGALSIDPSTGELTVADAALFDFETNPVITANISVVDAINTATAIATINLNNVAEIGDFNFGGVVFWLDGSGGGLVCAVEEQTSSIRWDNPSGPVTPSPGTDTILGSGSTNTDIIIMHEGAVETSYAAGIARAYNGGGFNDWFLPSVDEVAEMNNNKAVINTIATSNGGSDLPDQLWTSSTSGNTGESVFLYSLIIGLPNNVLPINLRSVRAVRAF